MQRAINCVRENVNTYTPSQLNRRGPLPRGTSSTARTSTLPISSRIFAHCICYVIKIQPSKYPYSLIRLSSNICTKKLVLRVSEIFIHRGATLGFFGQYHTIFLNVYIHTYMYTHAMHAMHIYKQLAERAQHRCSRQISNTSPS